MQRSLRGEVIASTFHRPPHEHIAARPARRSSALSGSSSWVSDVVVLLDSITRLGRAYNTRRLRRAAASCRGGIALRRRCTQPKRLLGRGPHYIEHGGSLTIIATALVDTGSQGDILIFEEFKSTGNAEFRTLVRASADKRSSSPRSTSASSGTRARSISCSPRTSCTRGPPGCSYALAACDARRRCDAAPRARCARTAATPSSSA